ncbi:MAG: outer membrane protein assembly factor BamD [Legionellales bacterium]|jgi:outer membrane protein assembly factor BamD|nr:outer membrane protein assembly factor BamD [Legionellales bacterium]
MYKLISSLLMLLVLQSCSTLTLKEEFENKSDSEMYVVANKYLQDGQYHSAAEFFEILNNKSPFTKNSERNRVLGIYSYYMDRNYSQAYAESNYFLQLYPRSEHVDWVMFMQAYSSYKEYRNWVQEKIGSDRARNDLSKLEDAYRKAQTLIDLYPKSKYVAAASLLQQKVNSIKARENMDVASFYFDKGAYIAAIKRSEFVLSEYSSSCLLPDSLDLLQASYVKLGLESWAKDIAKLKKINGFK